METEAMTDLTDPAAVLALLSGTTEGEWRVPSRAYWDLLGIDYINLYTETITEHATISTRLGEIAKYEDAALIAQTPALARALADALTELARLRAALDARESDGTWCAECGDRIVEGTLMRVFPYHIGCWAAREAEALHPAPDGAVVE